MNLLNLFEDDNRTPNPNYAEELAYQIFKAAPNLNTTGAADEVLDYAYDLVVNDFGKTKANALFAYDEDFDSDLVNAYLDLQMNQQAADKKQVNEVDPRNFDSDEDYYAALNAPAKRRSAPSDYPYSPEEDDAYFREIFRKKREAAKKAEQDKESGVTEGASIGPTIKANKIYYADHVVILDPAIYNSDPALYDEYVRDIAGEDLDPQGDAKYHKYELDRINNDGSWTVRKLKPKGVAEGRMSELDAEYQDYKNLSPREFYNMYRITKQAWLAKYKSMLPQQETVEGQRWPDSSNSIADRKAVVPNLDAYRRGETGGSRAGRPGGMTVATRVEPTITPTSVKRLGSEKPIPSFLQKGVAEGQEVDTSVVVGKLYDIIDHAEDVIKNADFDSQVQKATIVRDKASKALNMIKSGTDASSAFKYFQSGQQGVAEADKKKEDEPEVRDVALQRAISRAKADFPTAGSGIEALAKDFMRSQDQDSKSFDQLRQAERKQDQMLGQIAKIDKEQEQEIQGLENQNSTLASRLQQLQNVNGELEKKLAAMSGRRAEKKSTAADVSVAPVTATPAEPSTRKPKTKLKTKPQPSKSSMKSTAAQLAAPKADPMAAMTNRITKGDSSVIDKVSGQSALPFEPSDNVLEPVIPQQAQVNPRFAAAKANASDVDPRYGRELADRIKQQMAAVGRASPDYLDAERLRAMRDQTLENNEKEVDYDDPRWDAMVKRVGQKAQAQEKNKPVDIADLARRLAAIEASRKD